jgi:hypothetical protein
MFGNFSIGLKKYSVPVLFFILGILLFYAGIQGKQNMTFMISAVMMFVAGVMSILYSSGSFKSILLYIFGGVAGIAAMATFVLSYNSVEDTATYNKNYQLCRGKSIRNMEDIRTIQKAYAEKHGKYAKTWEELVEFAKSGTVPFVISEGVVPGRKISEAERNFIYKDNRPIDINMTEKEAYLLAKSAICPEDLKGFKRDTIQVSLIDTKFKNKSYIDSRMKSGFGKFYVDSLPYIPFTNAKEKWTLETNDTLKIGTEILPAMKVSGKIPFAKIQGTAGEELFMGTLTAPDVVGNWEDK